MHMLSSVSSSDCGMLIFPCGQTVWSEFLEHMSPFFKKSLFRGINRQIMIFVELNKNHASKSQFNLE